MSKSTIIKCNKAGLIIVPLPDNTDALIHTAAVLAMITVYQFENDYIKFFDEAKNISGLL